MPVFHQTYLLCDKYSACSFLSLLSTFLPMQQTVRPPPRSQSLSFPSVISFSLSCSPFLPPPARTPSCSIHSLCMQHALLPCRVGFACSGGACLLTCLHTHTHCFHICPFARVHNQNLHVCRFGDASQNTRLALPPSNSQTHAE